MKKNSTYKKRMSPVWEFLKTGAEHVRWNTNLVKSSRSGEYLIKTTSKYECVNGNGYVDYSYRDDGWMGLSTRTNAQWFTKKEATEITKDWKHFKIVKR